MKAKPAEKNITSTIMRMMIQYNKKMDLKDVIQCTVEYIMLCRDCTQK